MSSIVGLEEHLSLVNNCLLAMSYGIVTTLLVYAAFVDIRKKRIPNLLCLLILIIGFVVNSLVRLDVNIYWSIAGLLTGFLPLFLLHLLTGLGAGDVKLMAAIGSVVGAKSILIIFYYTFLLSGVYALGYLIFKGGVMEILKRYGRFFCRVFRGKHALDKPDINTVAARQIPMAPSIALATIYTLFPTISHLVMSINSQWNWSWI